MSRITETENAETGLYRTASTIAGVGIASLDEGQLKLASSLLEAFNAVSEKKHHGGTSNLTVNVRQRLTVDELKKTITDIISVMEAVLDQHSPDAQAVWNVTLGKLREYVSAN